MATHVSGDAAPIVQQFDGRAGDARVEPLSHERVWRAVVVAEHIDVVVDVDPGLLPLRVLVAAFWQRLEGGAVERLEVEWGRPWSALTGEARGVVDGDVAAWRAELDDLARQLSQLGPVNALAVAEHEEESERLAFLNGQRDDLVSARDDLVSAIRQINRTAKEMFTETFEAVRENFQRVFQSLFQGGQCDVWLAQPDDPLESTVEIQASPRGKRTQRIHLLSGGERTLTALALLFALYLVKPSPFCVLDEVDAPLDESNVGRFLQLLDDFKAETQFIVITHNTRTMEAADWVYGVTMEEPGVSTIVGVELLGRWTNGDPRTAPSAAAGSGSPAPDA